MIDVLTPVTEETQTGDLPLDEDDINAREI